MKVSKDELGRVLSQLHFWWEGNTIPDLPPKKRAIYRRLHAWTTSTAPRAVMLAGARQVGKTTLMLQTIDQLLDDGVPPANILYATFDDPMLKGSGIQAVLAAWRERKQKADGPEYLFLDEIQHVPSWGTWIKHQVDFRKDRRIVFSGSVMPLADTNQESGVGRWYTVKLATLSFHEYLLLRGAKPASLPTPGRLDDLFGWTEADFLGAANAGEEYVPLFHEYLAMGGFPQLARVGTVTRAQSLLREDILDRILRRDMTSLFGVRRVDELVNAFLYLCMQNGGVLDIQDLCDNLGVKRPTAQRFIDLLEAAHLIYSLRPFGYGQSVLRSRTKVYLADPALAPAVTHRGDSMLNDPQALGKATENAVFKHLFAHYHAHDAYSSYWRGKKGHEVDFVVQAGEQPVPFEVKYRAQQTGPAELKGLAELCETKAIPRAFVVCKSLHDFGKIPDLQGFEAVRIPAPFLCLWTGIAEAQPVSGSLFA